MVSDLALEDLAEIESEGGKVHPRDIIRLNALALKITHEPDCAIATLPRCVLIEDILFTQPTIEQDIFLDEAVKLFDGDDSTILALEAYVLAHGKVEEKWLRHPKMFAMKVGVWIKTKLGKVTADQLRNALDFCLYGADPTTGETPIIMTDSKEAKKLDGIGTDKSWALASYLNAVSLGIDSAAALRATSPQLAAMVERAYIYRQLPLTDKEKRATAEYFSTLDAIKKYALPQKKDEKENG